MGRTEWCELVSGVCRLTGGTEGHTEEPEGSEHVSAWLSAEEDARRTEHRKRRKARGAQNSGAQNRGWNSVVALRGAQV